MKEVVEKKIVEISKSILSFLRWILDLLKTQREPVNCHQPTRVLTKSKKKKRSREVKSQVEDNKKANRAVVLDYY